MTTNDPASAGSVKAEETEGAKEGLGVGEACVVCGQGAYEYCHDAAHPARTLFSIHPALTVSSCVHTHPYAPPSAPDRPRAPLEAALAGVQWSAHDEYGDLMCPECDGYMPGQQPGTLNVRRRGTGHRSDCLVGAALAGVPKEAGAPCGHCGHAHDYGNGACKETPCVCSGWVPVVAAPVEDAK